MTLLKGLSMACWLGYDRIFILGMDNTYPRNLYCDSNNRILNHEIHAGAADWVQDMTNRYNSIADAITEIAEIFYDTRKFSRPSIINLDPYSLTDAFRKAQDISCDVPELRRPA
jgi:hypothetical protein